ncbi:hypothetical protein F5148DRAFT_1237891, partial [Russula earlei]
VLHFLAHWFFCVTLMMMQVASSNMDTPDFRTSQYHPGLTLLASLNFGFLGAIPIRRSSRLLSIAETSDSQIIVKFCAEVLD